MNNIIIVGAGGFAKEVYSYIQDDISKGALRNCLIKGFLVDYIEDYNNLNVDKPYLGKIKEYKSIDNDKFIVAIGTNPGRSEVIKVLKENGAIFYTYCHSSAFIDQTATIGKGVIICPNTMVNANATIKNYSILNIYSSIAHDTILGTNSILSPYCTLNGHVETGDNIFMGTRSTILPKVKIGSNCTISAGTIVSKNMKDYSTAFPRVRTTYKEKKNAD